MKFSIKKINLVIIFLFISACPCFAEEPQQICPGVKELINSTIDVGDINNPVPNVQSYKATGKIYFLKKCADRDELCKTGSYIIAGDYFIAVPKVNGYYCAAYIPNSYTHPKAVGLIKGENFAETKLEEYKSLHYNDIEGLWTYKDGSDWAVAKFSTDERGNMTLYTEEGVNGLDHSGGFGGTIVLKTGPQSFVAGSAPEDQGTYDIMLKNGKLTLDNHGENGEDSDPIFGNSSGAYTYKPNP